MEHEESHEDSYISERSEAAQVAASLLSPTNEQNKSIEYSRKRSMRKRKTVAERVAMQTAAYRFLYERASKPEKMRRDRFDDDYLMDG